VAAASPTGSSNSGATLSTPEAPLGNATLSIASGLSPQPCTLDPLAGRPTFCSATVTATHWPSEASPSRTASLPTNMSRLLAAPNPRIAPKPWLPSKPIRSLQFAPTLQDGQRYPAPPGTYYLMISTVFNRLPLVWGQAVQLNAGANSIVLDQRNAVPLNGDL
jgi:hypothetical protein